MKSPLIWLFWLLGLVANAWIAVALANAVGFPLWMVVGCLILLESVPLLWIMGVIKKSLFINQAFVGGYWITLQALMFMIEVMFFFELPIIVTTWGVGLSLLLVPLCIVFMYLRTRSMIQLLSKYG